MVFGWRKRRAKRPHKRPPRKLPRRVLAPVEEIVEQGLLVADVAVRMTVKNAIIMNALKRHLPYDEDQIADMVREVTTELADERDHDARHISRMRGEIRETGRSAWSESEYGNEDNRTLRHRQEVYETVATQLRELVDDPEWVKNTAERARAAAWDEIGDSLKERASHPYYAGGSSEEYRAVREDRIQQLIEKDLTDLMREHGAAQEAPKKRKLLGK